MTHFTALVILPPDTSNIQDKVAELLLPIPPNSIPYFL